MDILILGAGAHAREVCNWVRQAGYNVIGFYASVKGEHNSLRSLPVFYDIDKIPKNAFWVIGVGSPKTMTILIKQMEGVINAAPAIIHPSCVIGDNVNIGNGTIICPLTVITCDVKIGKSVVVNTGCTIGHDVLIGDMIHISPNVSLSGSTIIRNGCELGTGVATIPHVSITENCVIGAGALVTRSICESGTYVGTPARLLNKPI